jgi:two-component sensor histidine kinase
MNAVDGQNWAFLDIVPQISWSNDVLGTGMTGRTLIPVRRPRWWQSLLWGVSAASAALVVRGLLDPVLLSNSPYITCFAAVLVATVWGGLLGGFTVAVFCGPAAYWAFGRIEHVGAEHRSLWGPLVFLGMATIEMALAEAMATALRREAELTRRLEVISREFQHRAKNGSAVAIAVVEIAARNATSVDDLKMKVVDRFRAFAAVQDVVDNNLGKPSSMVALVELVLKPFDTDGRIVLAGEGADPAIAPNRAVALSLVLNELATNAAKYGALSSAKGEVKLSWAMQNDRVKAVWAEREGPLVSPPARTGFGSRLFRMAFPDGEVSTHYDPAGVRCEFEFSPH